MINILNPKIVLFANMTILVYDVVLGGNECSPIVLNQGGNYNGNGRKEQHERNSYAQHSQW
jgi:hypothetical protein